MALSGMVLSMEHTDAMVVMSNNILMSLFISFPFVSEPKGLVQKSSSSTYGVPEAVIPAPLMLNRRL